MSIEKRGPSYRAKVWVGKALVAQRTFATRAEAVAFEKLEKARRTVAAGVADWTVSGEQQAVAAADNTVALPPALGQALYRGWCIDQQGNTWREPGDWDDEPKSRALGTDLPARTLADIATRYRDEVTVKKKSAEQETCKLTAILLTHKIAKKRVGGLSKKNFQDYRDDRIGQVGPSTVKKELHLWHAILEHAREEWGLDLKENPASIRAPQFSDVASDRRLLDGEEARLLAACDPLMHDAVSTSRPQRASRW